MTQTNAPSFVWHVSLPTSQFEYIVAAEDASAAGAAFRGARITSNDLPAPFPETQRNAAGRTLAESHPGKVYRRKSPR